MFTIILMIILTILNPFVEVTVGRCTNDLGDGKVYNGEPYYNYIRYNENKVHENDIVITGFILNEYGECEVRLFDAVVCKDTK